MKLQDTFKVVHPSIVALGSRFAMGTTSEVPPFPTIYGTGFIVDPRGLVATNRHVAEELVKVPNHPETGSPGVFAHLYLSEKTNDEITVTSIFPDIIDVKWLDTFTNNAEQWFGMPIPDIAFLQLEVTDVPALNLIQAPNTIEMGMPVAVAGFPLGDIALSPHGHLSQITPFLRKGIVSSVYPCPCPFPQGFTLDIPIQGGSSGSPVFLEESPDVIGIVFGSMVEDNNITLAIPSYLISAALSSCLQNVEFEFLNRPTLNAYVESLSANSGLNWETYKPTTNQ